MKDRNLNKDTQAILLLCGSFGKKGTETSKPLNLKEYNRLCQWIQAAEMKPADLLQPDAVNKLITLSDKTIDPGRLITLLARGAAMALAMESWGSKGIWVVSRSEDDYPQRLKKILKRSAPPLIFGVGNRELLESGGLAVVGSRNVDEEGLEFTRQIAAKCVQGNIQIVSGGARGVDEKAMQTALHEGGTVIGVLGSKLEQAAVSGKYRKWLMEGTLVLVSPYSPKAPFNVGYAMGRNKHIYAMSEWALVISSTVGKGGTWAGANENLKNDWVPLFVRSGPLVPDGNYRLIQMGGRAMTEEVLSDDIDIRPWLSGHKDEISEVKDKVAEIRNITTAPTDLEIEPTDTIAPVVAEPQNEDSKDHDLFEVVWPHIESELKTAKPLKELVEIFNVNQKQMSDWLKQALEAGKVKKLSKPVRYVAIMQKELWS